MALGNTPRREITIAVEANKSYAFAVYFKSADGSPVDLTDSVLRLVAAEQAQYGGKEVLSAIAVPAGDYPEMQQFELQAEDLALRPGSYAYDVTLIPPSGYSVPILKGTLEVNANTDQDTSNVYETGVGTGSDITAVMEEPDVVEVTIERIDGLFMLVQELIKDFREEIAREQASMDAKVAAADASAQLAYAKAEELRGWFESVGFPFWKGTQEEYDAIPDKDPNVLYLIIA